MKSNENVFSIKKLPIQNININSYDTLNNQATINIGTIGHVAHGKSTFVKKFSG